MKNKIWFLLLCVSVCFLVIFKNPIIKSVEALGSAAESEISLLDDSEYVTITVRYLDGISKDQIFSPYTATIERGTDFTAQNVISPTFLGYAPYYNATDASCEDPEQALDSASVLKLAYSSVNQNQVVNVYYKASDVPYASRYYFQNIYDDQYTENETLYKNGTAKTGTIIADEVLTEGIEAVGFTKLYHYPESVAADGSTVFECYYDRNYYLIKFDMNGGYGVEPIYARYETPFAVNDPIKHGYVFLGWDKLDENGNGDGVADILPSTIPAENQNYRALWETKETTYTVVYWKENPDDNGYSYWGKETLTANSSEQVIGSEITEDDASRIGLSDFRFFSYNQSKTEAEGEKTVNGDGSTVVNVYYDRNIYTLKFYYAKQDSDSQYWIVGGSSYGFSGVNKSNKDKASGSDVDGTAVYEMIEKVPSTQWGSVTDLPQLNDAGSSRPYSIGSESYNGITYYYFSFRAKYGSDISELWPIGIFDPIKTSTNYNYGDYAYFSAWTVEHHTYYSSQNSNKTLKGNYLRLDYQILYDYRKYEDSDTVCFLAFWENGAKVNWNKPNQWIYNIFLPLQDGEEEIADEIYKTYNEIRYKLFATYDTCDDNTAAKPDTQTASAVEGFTYKARAVTTNEPINQYRNSYTIDFYYDRNTYTLTFKNYGSDADEWVISGVPYETSLSQYKDYVPDYPSTLEENAYEFMGWYTSPGCYEGTEVDWDTLTMPAGDIMLYAKWTPVNHNVCFFKTYDAMLEYENSDDKEATLQKLEESGLFLEKREVPHGNLVGSIENPPALAEENLEYDFAGWFYMENGEKKAYTPLDMPVNDDMNVFADWGSYSPQPYTIHYVLKNAETDSEKKNLLNEQAGGSPQVNVRYTIIDSDGESSYVYWNDEYHLCIANDTTGYGYQGSTRTFTPKAGSPYNQLYNDYNSGYFPTLSSHSITMRYEEDKTNPVNNVFTFTYVNADSIAYKVKYVDKNTGKELLTSETKYTSDAVITERFQAIADYLPDSFYKRLVLSVEEDPDNPGNYIGSEKNEIIFYYTQNDSSSFYAVHFMLQKPGTSGTDYKTDGSGDYYENDSHIEGIADTDTDIEIAPLTFSGFSVVTDLAYVKINGSETGIAAADGKFTITVNSSGTELYIFYTREKVDYKVYYLEYGTDISDLSILEQENPDKGVLKDAKTVSGMEYDSIVTENAVKIAGYNCVSANTQTITIRYETSKNTIIFYYASLQYTVEYCIAGDRGGMLTQTNETIMGDGTFAGAEAVASTGWQFEGWFLDEDCTISVGDTADVTGNKLVPKKEGMQPSPDINTFYAKFTQLYGSLTITRSNTADEGNGAQVFVYEITNNDNGDVIYVTVSDSGSITVKDLLYGNYTVKQMNDWSWRYSDALQTVTVEGSANVSFGNTADGKQWLSGNSTVSVNQKGGSN
ncbi:MAG: InlB B-repeat-containing protein [Lachnospiraceae bacterium]